MAADDSVAEKLQLYGPQHQSTETHRAETTLSEFLSGPDLPLALVVATVRCRNWTLFSAIANNQNSTEGNKLPQLYQLKTYQGRNMPL